MPTDDTHLTPDLQAALQHRILRVFFISVAVVGVLGAVVAPWLGGPLPLPAHGVMMMGYGSLAALAVIGSRAAPATARRLMGAVLLGGFLQVGLVGLLTGWGLQTPGLAFFAIAVGIAHVVGSPRMGHASLALTLVVVLALTIAERLGVVPGAPRLGARAVMLAAALICSALVSQGVASLLQQHLAAAAARARRFRALLGIAATAYWETDATGAFTQVSRRNRQGEFQPLTGPLGQRPWSMPRVQWEGDSADRLHAAMAARQPLHDLPFCWQGTRGDQRHALFSGEPRHDANGQFVGHWGVVCDVTAEHQAQAAQRATENRYRDLFNHVPLPLVLHRHGRVLDANPATARLLGYDSVDDLIGVDLLQQHMPEASRLNALSQMALAASTGAPPQSPLDQVLRTCDGRLITVKIIGTCTNTPDGPAMLSIGIDETERLAAAQALARSQALLERVVAMSPDVIALTEMPSGRYVMVNPSFTRLLGYAPDEVVGRTSLELGLWCSPDERTQLAHVVGDVGGFREALVHLVSKDGREVPLAITGTHFHDDGRDYALTNARDLSESARARLEREAILANASVGIAFTRQRRFELANPQFEAIFGWPTGSLAGQPGRAVWPSEADYAALGREIGPALSRGDAVDVERQATRRDGSVFVVRMRAKAIDPHRPADSGTIWIAEDVTAARQADQALARARDAAEAASRAKSAFLANTSHEIRTPLNGLTGLARLARQPGVPPERLRQYLDQIGESADLLSSIISDILDLSKIEAGKLDVESVPFDLDALLRSLQQAHAALAAGHGLSFEAQIDPALPTHVRGDALRLRQILSNYLHNALKFTTQGGIRLVVRPGTRGQVRFEVHDTGPGIAAATQARLFQPFTQADESTTRRYGGTGLGLSICRELATLMGGTVGLDSAPGRGSCFHAELPLPAVTGDDLVQVDEAEGDPRLRGARVLLVEDNSINMMIGVALLQQWGVLVTEAVDGSQALAAVDRATAAGQPFDAVLMDLQMPGLSGYQTTEALRRQHSAARLPVIALTAAALVSERERVQAAGMNGFLTKPIDPRELQRALLRVLQRHPA